MQREGPAQLSRSRTIQVAERVKRVHLDPWLRERLNNYRRSLPAC
ncbi:hypothetical protein [Kocuria arenosa]